MKQREFSFMPGPCPGGRLWTAALTMAALAAFAANSVLCRRALGGAAIDAASFSALRLLSGAAMLWLLVRVRGRYHAAHRGNWISAAALTLYAVAFSFAYLSLATGTGALILFGAVQATMILTGLRSGERPRLLEWVGLAVALVGLVMLVLPGLSAPSPSGSMLMAVAGIAWGAYSLRGRGGGDPVVISADNFIRSVPLALGAGLFMLPRLHASPMGVLLAVVSGSLASGLGYVVWYAALRGLTATFAATVQLSVPVLAAAGGVIFLDENVSLRLLLSGAAILGGVALAALSRALSFSARGRGPTVRN